jgi:flagellar biosynthesis GTPase FlhF
MRKKKRTGKKRRKRKNRKRKNKKRRTRRRRRRRKERERRGERRGERREDDKEEDEGKEKEEEEAEEEKDGEEEEKEENKEEEDEEEEEEEEVYWSLRTRFGKILSEAMLFPAQDVWAFILAWIQNCLILRHYNLLPWLPFFLELPVLRGHLKSFVYNKRLRRIDGRMEESQNRPENAIRTFTGRDSHCSMSSCRRCYVLTEWKPEYSASTRGSQQAAISSSTLTVKDRSCCSQLRHN